MYVQVDMAGSPQADRVQVMMPAYAPSGDMLVEICTAGRWERVPSHTTEGPMLNLRPQAMQILKQAGITHIVTPAAYQGIGVLGEKLVNESSEWNVGLVGNLNAIYLLKLR